MWNNQFYVTSSHTPFGQRTSKSAPCSPLKPLPQKASPVTDSFHVVHKVPVGDTPYVKAKHVQLVDKDPDRAVALFWAAINAGDRVDSALKDMATVMKQQNRPQEAIEAIKSLRVRCSDQAQESLDNVLLDLYKRCGRLEDQIALLKHKLHLIHQGMAFNGKRTKTARSQGKKFQVSIEQEATRLLGNLGWAYMQQSNFVAAEAVYRKALTIERDNNKVCNLGICLMKQGRLDEAKAMLQSVTPSCNDNRWASDSHLKSYERAQEMLLELETSVGSSHKLSSFAVSNSDLNVYDDLQHFPLWEPQPALPRQPRQMARSNLEGQFSQVVDPGVAGALFATAGFGPSQNNGSAWTKPGVEETLSHSTLGVSDQRDDAQAWQLQSGVSGSGEDTIVNYPSADETLDTDKELQLDNDAYSSAGRLKQQWHAKTLQQCLDAVPAVSNSWNACLPSYQASALGFCDGDLLARNPSPFGEQTLRSSAEPFNPPAITTKDTNIRQQMNPPSSDRIVMPKITSSTIVAVDSLPLTFDRTNELGNGSQNRNSRTGGAEDGGISKQSSYALMKNSAALSEEWNKSEDYDENQPNAQCSIPKTSFGVQYNVAPQPQQQLHSNATGKRSRTLTPVKEKSVTPWACLGFTHSPRDTDFGFNDRIMAANDTISVESAFKGLEKEVLADVSASVMEMQRQRRLRVFQEMTPSGSLQA